MDTKEKKDSKANTIFFIVLALLIFGSVGITFYKIVILKDYQIVAQVSCNPLAEKCFVTECDPETDDTCTATSTPTYYKNISKKAASIYACEASVFKTGCRDELTCTRDEVDCSYTYCNSAQLQEGEKCSE